uniref:Large ribosomal subunit protein uL3c n=1 Tax=Pleurostichidium falkenbergii TaxID=121064 RepID=A0A4D6UYU6_9FLOR|nr:ribosomal protein L3 [Pleurostichidium falkenbergii]QCH39694.1 ribosomal protein L3 [Pleurostichidium falkenbergii]
MSIGILGKKIGMTQIFDEQGYAIPATLLEVGPCTVTHIKQDKKYTKIQIGYEYIQPNKISKPIIGYFKKQNLPCFKHLKEYKDNDLHELSTGQILNISQINKANYINISGVSIGKGFSGYQKRHNFSRGPMSHGSKNHREPGSIGAGTTPGRVFPGKKMAGRMGYKKVSIKNISILNINKENNTMLIKGSIPGKRGNIIYIHQK